MVTLEEIKNLIDVKIKCKPSLGQVSNYDLARVLKKIIEYTNDNDDAGGVDPGEEPVLIEFEYIYPDANGVLNIDGTVRKAIISTDITVSAGEGRLGESGVLIIKQDDKGGHLIKFAEGSYGSVVLNTLPRAITQFDWVRTDEGIYFTSRAISEGLRTTQVPTISINDYYDTLEVFFPFPNSELLMSVNWGPWVPYNGKINIGAFDRPAGYWRFKIKEAVGRLESEISESLPVFAAKKGFPYVLPVKLK